MSADPRIMKELKDLMKEDVSGVSARLVKEGDLRFLEQFA